MINSTGKNAFTTIYVLFLITGASLLYNFKQPEIELAINGFNSTYSDYFFKYITFFGDGIFYTAVCLIICIFDWKKGIVAGFIGAFQGLIVQGLKYFVFAEAPRPMHTFEVNPPNITPHLVDGVQVHAFGSFPSGHTATAFALAICIIFVFTSHKPLLSLLLFLTAALVGYSRIYLLQHFFIDVYMGSIIGVFTSISIWNIANKHWFGIVEE
ncbi:MAG: phosphatase PAP2 family protein [Cytophagales bacterium]|nr:MAG: phosphatase PAP2 family protein [Cytophagales bacterium]